MKINKKLKEFSIFELRHICKSLDNCLKCPFYQSIFQSKKSWNEPIINDICKVASRNISESFYEKEIEFDASVESESREIEEK